MFKRENLKFTSTGKLTHLFPPYGKSQSVQPHLLLSTAFYILVNALFIAKYSSRIFPTAYPYITLGIILLYYLFVTYALPWLITTIRQYGKAYIAILLCCIVAIIALQYYVDPYTLKVDRWSALHNPIKNLLSGTYPYLATTHMRGFASPFPIWQLFHIPFYLLGNVGLSFFAVMALFVWSTYRQWGIHVSIAISVLLILSPAVWYEAIVRSDFLTNILLLVALINMCINRISVEWVNRHLILLGIGIAMLACTRLITLIPIAILLWPYYLRLRISSKIILIIVFLAVFVATFLPFALWDWQAFFCHHYNPWKLQTRQGHIADFLIFIPIAILLAMKWHSDISRYYAYTAVMLCSFVGGTILHRMYDSNNYDIFCQQFDITYLNSILPFAITAMILGITKH